MLSLTRLSALHRCHLAAGDDPNSWILSMDVPLGFTVYHQTPTIYLVDNVLAFFFFETISVIKSTKIRVCSHDYHLVLKFSSCFRSTHTWRFNLLRLFVIETLFMIIIDDLQCIRKDLLALLFLNLIQFREFFFYDQRILQNFYADYLFKVNKPVIAIELSYQLILADTSIELCI